MYPFFGIKISTHFHLSLLISAPHHHSIFFPKFICNFEHNENLVIEDEKELLEAITASLEKELFLVEAAGDFNAAFEKISRIL